MKTYYDVLKITKEASSKDVKVAYRRLAVSLHPDKCVGMSAYTQLVRKDKFIEVAEAYNVLRDREKRNEYDIMLSLLNSEEYYTPPVPTRVEKHVAPKPVPGNYPIRASANNQRWSVSPWEFNFTPMPAMAFILFAVALIFFIFNLALASR